MKWLMKVFSRANRLGFCLVFVAATGACSYQGGDIGNPLTRRFQWPAFVGGSDIRASCAPGAPDRYRVVYNGFWEQQVRVYELGLSEPRQLDQRVLSGLELSQVTTQDLAAPWRGATAKTALTPAQYDRLLASFAASDMFGKPPAGLRLPSDGFYWTVVGCRQGQFFYNAWLYPSERFEHLSFPAELIAADRTGVDFNPPNSAGYIANYSQQRLQRERWFLEVGDKGFIGS